MKLWKRLLAAFFTVVALALLLDAATARSIRLTQYRVSCPNLPAAFEGLRVAQISDLHGAFLWDGGASLAESVSKAKPDLIAMTGDLFDRSTDLSLIGPAMERLCQIAPVYYVSGNHEWTVSQRRTVWRDMEDAGVIFLENDWVILERDGQSIALVGMEDPNGPADMATPAQVLEQLRQQGGSGLFTLLLYHRNDGLDTWAELRVDLTLCGHGHGGLIRLPLIGGLADTDRGLFPKFDAGVYQKDASAMVVSRGLGNNPGTFRLFNGPEIPIITLTLGEGG